MPSTVWDEITYPFPNFNGCTVEVWEWMCNIILYFIIDVITVYPVAGVYKVITIVLNGNTQNMIEFPEDNISRDGIGDKHHQSALVLCKYILSIYVYHIMAQLRHST